MFLTLVCHPGGWLAIATALDTAEDSPLANRVRAALADTQWSSPMPPTNALALTVDAQEAAVIQQVARHLGLDVGQHPAPQPADTTLRAVIQQVTRHLGLDVGWKSAPQPQDTTLQAEQQAAVAAAEAILRAHPRRERR